MILPIPCLVSLDLWSTCHSKKFRKSHEQLWSQETENAYNSQKNSNLDCQKKSLLNLAESLWSLELERTSYLILLLIVLFSSQGGQVDNLKDVDRYQNQYMMLLYRFGFKKIFQYLQYKTSLHCAKLIQAGQLNKRLLYHIFIAGTSKLNMARIKFTNICQK